MTKGRGTPRKRKPPVGGDNAALAGELTGVFVRQTLALTREELRHWAGQKGVLSRRVGDVLHAPFKPPEVPKPDIAVPGPRSMRLPPLEEISTLDSSRWLEVWQRVYWEITGIEPGFQNISVPADPGGFGWVIVATPEVPLNRFWAGLREKFFCWCYGGDDLKSLLNWEREQRSYRNGANAIRVRPREEADEEFASRSAAWLAERGTKTITLPERAYLEGFYWEVSGGKHLDVRNHTLCAGSRDRDGFVPSAYWSAGGAEFRVYWYDVRLADPLIRAREVVSV